MPRVRTRIAGLLAVLTLVVVASLFAAASAQGAPSHATARLEAPRLLPGDLSAAARRAQDPATWLVGARPSAAATIVARRFHAKRLLDRSPAYVVRRQRARAFVKALDARGLYAYSEPNLRLERYAFPGDPLAPAQWAIPSLDLFALTPPAVTGSSPLLAVIEGDFEPSHPEFLGAPITTAGSFRAGFHGTAITSVAAAPANGRGMLGAFPGVRVLVVGSADTCGRTAAAIDAAVEAGARVINMSCGFLGGCFTHQIATNFAYGQGVTLVAAAGNEGEVGLKTFISPASDPHVVTVAALAPGDVSPAFSNANQAVDISAPGQGVLAAVPSWYDVADGTTDGTPLSMAPAFPHRWWPARLRGSRRRVRRLITRN